MHTAESEFSHFIIKYLCEIENEFKNTWGPIGFESWKKYRGQQSRDTLPLKHHSSMYWYWYKQIRILLYLQYIRDQRTGKNQVW